MNEQPLLQAPEANKAQIPVFEDPRPSVDEVLSRLGLGNLIEKRDSHQFQVDPQKGFLQAVIELPQQPPDYASFLTDINKLFPTWWSSKNGTGLMFPIADGIVSSAVDGPLAKGLHLNGLTYLLLTYQNPEMHICFVANILSELKREGLNSEQKKYIAKLAMYVACPIAEIYGLTDLLVELQDVAFATLDPENYKWALEEWNTYYGTRLTADQLDTISTYTKIDLANATSITGWEANIRQKSLFSFYRKLLTTGIVEDYVAQTLTLDEKSLLTQSQRLDTNLSIEETLRRISEILLSYNGNITYAHDPKISTPTYPQVFETRSTFGNGDYRAMKFGVRVPRYFFSKGELEPDEGQDHQEWTPIDPKYDHRGIVKVSLTTSENYRRNQIEHPIYKLFYRNGNQEKVHIGFTRKDVGPLVDWARRLLQSRLHNNSGEPYVLENSTRRMGELEAEMLNKKRCMIMTPNGTNTVWINRELDIEDQLHFYSRKIHEKFMNHSLFQVSRVENGATVRYFVNLNTRRIVRCEGSLLQWEEVDFENFNLQNFDKATILTDLKIPTDGLGRETIQLTEFESVHKLLTRLANPIYDASSVKVTINDVECPGLAIAWQQKLLQINTVLGSFTSPPELRVYAMKLYTELCKEVGATQFTVQTETRDEEGATEYIVRRAVIES